MRIFISWSGGQSKAVAEALKDWLSVVVQSVDPWVSSRDIEKGTISMDQLNSELKDCKFGITCLTPDNLGSPWIHFEAGAIASAVMGERNGRLWTFLLGLSHPTDVQGPLSQFQHTMANEEDTKRLLNDINKALEKPLTESQVQRLFQQWWPELERKLCAIAETTSSKLAKRPPESMIEETLELVRGLSRERAELSKGGYSKSALDPAVEHNLKQFGTPGTSRKIIGEMPNDFESATPLALRSAPSTSVKCCKCSKWINVSVPAEIASRITLICSDCSQAASQETK